MTLGSPDPRTIAGQGGPAAESAPPTEAQTAEEQLAENLTLSEARDLLDWLEGHGIRAQDLEMDPAGRVTVRWVG